MCSPTYIYPFPETGMVSSALTVNVATPATSAPQATSTARRTNGAAGNAGLNGALGYLPLAVALYHVLKPRQ